MIPQGLTHDHFLQAAAEIDLQGVPDRRESTRYDLILNGNTYPPKYVISLASRHATGTEFAFSDFNAIEAKHYFETRGYEIADRLLEPVFELLPNKERRMACLNVFADSLLCAHDLGPQKWCVHRNRGKIRLLVGNLIVCTLFEEKVWLALDKTHLESAPDLVDALDRSPFWSWDTYDYPEYKQVPSRNGFFQVDGNGLGLWESLKPAHFDFLLRVTQKYRGLKENSRSSHLPEMVSAVGEIIGRVMPVADFDAPEMEDILAQDLNAVSNLPVLETEKETLVRGRVGQGEFRRKLLVFWRGRCAVTGCSSKEVLRASHIKPWSVSSNEERLDYFNGLLLTPNLDAAFDRGLISFRDDGLVLISRDLSEEQQANLGLREDMRLRQVRQAHATYLDYHRANVFKGSVTS